MPTKGREIFKVIHKNGDFVLYHLREKIFFEKPYIFRVPVIYPLREKVFSSTTSMDILPLLTAYLLREQNFFGKHLLKRSLPVGISREKKFRQHPKKCPPSLLT